MSKNLLKGRYTTVKQESRRVIDMNELVEKRIEELVEKMKKPENQGFVSGLNAVEIEVDELLVETEEDKTKSDIVKVGEGAESILNKARQDAELIMSEVKAQAEKYLIDARAQAERERNQLLAQAREQGYQEGLRQAEEEIENRVRKKEDELNREYDSMMEELEPRIVDVLSGIYEHVIHVDFSSYREILVYLISSTMSKIDGTKHYVIRVASEDYPYISMQKKNLEANVGSVDGVIEVVEDLSLSKNECMIEAQSGIFDCGLETQLSELSQKLKLLSYERKE